ncbi:MAG: FKBP-type peptidyl-prolyl cis-trans isomerase [Croceibacterium sp.]
MTEVTRVPLKPVSKTSLLMLLLGILIGLAIAGAFAWWSAPKGVDVDTLTAGTGAHPKADDVVFLRYTGKLKNGTVFDKSQDPQLPVKGILPEGYPMQLSGMIPGFRDAVMEMQKGGKYTVTIPAEKAYGASPPPGSPIPANADLTFDIELIDFMALPEAERRFQVLQQMMAAQQAKPGATPPGAPAPPPAPATAPAPAPLPRP